MKFPTIEEIAQDVADKALDEIEYKGKTLRQWIEIILATDNNVGTKLGTNLAEVGTDLISRQAAIDALAKFVPYAICDESTESYTNGLTDAYNLILQLPPAQPKTTRRIVGKSKGGMTLWYECERCGEPVDEGDKFCRGCGRRLIHE